MRTKRVLIVEDQGITALDEDRIMQELGYKVVGMVMSGEEAIERALKTKPDVILMDIRLSGVIDGEEAAKKIREQLPIPVIFVTAYGNKEQSKSMKGKIPQGLGYIVKPFTKEELQAEIERVTN